MGEKSHIGDDESQRWQSIIAGRLSGGEVGFDRMA